MGSTPETDAPSAVLAVGANVGDRLGNIRAALQQLRDRRIEVVRLSRLYESAAAYVTDQPAFLNAALAVRTHLGPRELLAALKDIEAAAGRDFQEQRFGPRPLDLDIIFHGDTELQDPVLQIPHPRWHERDFVIAPLTDLYAGWELRRITGGLASRLGHAQELWSQAGGEAQLGSAALRCVLPLRQQRLLAWQGRTRVMGVLNVTPDSFSDGGRAGAGPAAAVQRARQLVAEGADMLDVGGQSTRPGAALLPPEEELARVLPVLRSLREQPDLADVPISVDTFWSGVARESVAAGADMVNDVSGGSMDPDMHATVAAAGVAYVLMHMRGTPSTMQAAQHTRYEPGGLAAQVGRELQAAAERAIAAGIEPWRIATDPGIGFAKSMQGNCELIRDLGAVRAQLRGCLAGQPMLAGPSRKGFLGKLTGVERASDRDTASAVAAGLCVAGGASIVRMHSAAAGRDAARVSDAVLRRVPRQ